MRVSLPESRSRLAVAMLAALSLLAGCQAQSQTPLIVPVMRSEAPRGGRNAERTPPAEDASPAQQAKPAAKSTRATETAKFRTETSGRARQSSGAASANSPSGAALEQAIRERFARSKVAEDNLQVRVEGTTAYLTGHTDVVQHKGAATRMAKTTGATRVVNRIEVSKEARDAAAQRLERGRRSAKRDSRQARSGTR